MASLEGYGECRPPEIRSPDRPAHNDSCTDYTILAHVVTMATSNDHGKLSGHQCFRLMAIERFSFLFA